MGFVGNRYLRNGMGDIGETSAQPYQFDGRREASNWDWKEVGKEQASSPRLTRQGCGRLQQVDFYPPPQNWFWETPASLQHVVCQHLLPPEKKQTYNQSLAFFLTYSLNFCDCITIQLRLRIPDTALEMLHGHYDQYRHSESGFGLRVVLKKIMLVTNDDNDDDGWWWWWSWWWWSWWWWWWWSWWWVLKLQNLSLPHRTAAWCADQWLLRSWVNQPQGIWEVQREECFQWDSHNHWRDIESVLLPRDQGPYLETHYLSWSSLSSIDPASSDCAW